MVLQLVWLIEVGQLAISINQVQLTLKKGRKVIKIMVFCFKEHLQWVVCNAPNRPPENPHPGRTLRLPGVRLHQVRFASLFDEKIILRQKYLSLLTKSSSRRGVLRSLV